MMALKAEQARTAATVDAPLNYLLYEGDKPVSIIVTPGEGTTRRQNKYDPHTMAIADGSMSVDGREIYVAEDLRVGLFHSTDNF